MGLSLKSSHINIRAVLHTGAIDESGDVMLSPDLISASNGRSGDSKTQTDVSCTIVPAHTTTIGHRTPSCHSRQTRPMLLELAA